MSYTTFEDRSWKSVEVQPGTAGKATVTVTNTGDVAGKDVAQLYVQAPYTEGGIEKSAIQLVESQKHSFLDQENLKLWEIEINRHISQAMMKNAGKLMKPQAHGFWMKGYYFAFGNGAHEALNNVLARRTDLRMDLCL